MSLLVGVFAAPDHEGTCSGSCWLHEGGGVWRLADRKAPDAGGTVTVDLLVIAHSDKEDAAPTGSGPTGTTR